LTESLPAGLFRTRLTAEFNDETSQVWQSLLSAFAPDSETKPGRIARERSADTPREIRGPLSKVEPGPWRSLGGYLDYSHWQDRERFLELDRAIAAAPSQLEAEDEEFLPTAA
jgi:hypothetical protein